MNKNVHEAEIEIEKAHARRGRAHVTILEEYETIPENILAQIGDERIVVEIDFGVERTLERKH